MKLLHLADLHAGLTTHSRPDPDTGLPSRLLDVARSFHWAAREGIARGADLVVLAGDSFHDANPSAAALALLAGTIRGLRDSGLPVYILAGNHDRGPHPGSPSVLEALAGPGVAVCTRPEVVELGDLRIAGLPSVSRHQAMAQGEARSALEGDQAVRDGLRRILGGLAAEGADVLVGHWPVTGSVLGAEADIAIIPEPMLDPADLAGPWRYTAFGHIHQAQALSTEGLGTYAGSICQMNFGEEGQEKGGFLVDLDDERAPLRWLAVPGRPFLTLTEGLELEEDLRGAIVRVRPAREVADPEKASRELLERGASSVRFLPPPRERAQARAPELRPQLGTAAALELWAARNIDDEEQRARLLLRAEELEP